MASVRDNARVLADLALENSRNNQVLGPTTDTNVEPITVGSTRPLFRILLASVGFGVISIGFVYWFM